MVRIPRSESVPVSIFSSISIVVPLMEIGPMSGGRFEAT